MRWLLAYGSLSLNSAQLSSTAVPPRPSALKATSRFATGRASLWAARSPLWHLPHTPARSLRAAGSHRALRPLRQRALRSAPPSSLFVYRLGVGAVSSPTRATAFRVLMQARALAPAAVRRSRAFARAAHNPSLNRTRYGRPPGRLWRRKLSSPAPARRPASARRLARTLGLKSPSSEDFASASDILLSLGRRRHSSCVPCGKYCRQSARTPSSHCTGSNLNGGQVPAWLYQRSCGSA